MGGGGRLEKWRIRLFKLPTKLQLKLSLAIKATGRLKKMDLLYLFDILGTKKQISKLVVSSEI